MKIFVSIFNPNFLFYQYNLLSRKKPGKVLSLFLLGIINAIKNIKEPFPVDFVGKRAKTPIPFNGAERTETMNRRDYETVRALNDVLKRLLFFWTIEMNERRRRTKPMPATAAAAAAVIVLGEDPSFMRLWL